MASDSSKRFSAAANRHVLTPVMTLKGHEPVTRTLPKGENRTDRDVTSVCYSPDGKQLISGSIDKTARRWDLRAGKEIEEARDVCEQEIRAVGVSKDGQWVVTAVGDKYIDQTGELKVCEAKTGIVRTFECHHSEQIRSIDISADTTLLVSASDDSAQIWELDTGKLVFEIKKKLSCRGSQIVRFSQDSKKLALKPGVDNWLEVWDVQAQKKDVSIPWTSKMVMTSAPVFWTTKDKTIVAVYFKDDVRTTTKPESYPHLKIIYEFDALTLETVGAPFESHTAAISGLALSFDCALLASASWDQTIKLWAFESRQLLASFDVQSSTHLLFSPNSYQLACTRWQDTKIYICDIPPKILANIFPAQDAPNTNDLLHSDAIPRAARRKPVISPIPYFARPSPTTHSQRPTFFHHLRKFISSPLTNAAPPVLRDPLDFPATSPLPRNSLPLTQGRSGMNPHENARPIPTLPTTESSTTFKTRLHNLSTWWPVRTGHALPPIVDVPLAQGKERNASADAPPKNSEGYILDEDYIPSRPPSTNPNSQPPTVQINTGEHGTGRLCGCF